MKVQRRVQKDFNLENARPPYPDHPYFSGAEDYPFRPRTTLFDLVNAWWLAEAATLVYSDRNFIEERFRAARFNHVEPFEREGTECYVAHQDEFAIVAFRGTETRAEAEGTPTGDFRNVIEDVATGVDFKLIDSKQGGLVHQGFKRALDQVWDPLASHLSALLAQGKSLWFTGHSLGAALATLAADRFGDVSGLYTFGSPRVGDESFREDFFIPTYRFVNNNDLVCRVPPPPLYLHVGELKYIDYKGGIRDDSRRWERVADGLVGQAVAALNAAGRLRIGFRGQLPDGLVDHVPTLYATHIWNSLP